MKTERGGCLMCRNQHRESKEMKKDGNMFRIKEQDKSPETDPNKMEICDFPDRGFRIMVIKMLT